MKTKSWQKYLRQKAYLEGIETILKESYNARRHKQEKAAISKMKKKPKAFFAYAKKFSRTKSEVGPFLDEAGNLVTSPESIVKMLKKQYESVFSNPDESMEVLDPDNFFSVNDAEEQLESVVFDREVFDRSPR